MVVVVEAVEGLRHPVRLAPPPAPVLPRRQRPFHSEARRSAVATVLAVPRLLALVVAVALRLPRRLASAARLPSLLLHPPPPQ